MSVEVTVRYRTTVDTLSEAWAFVMGHLDGLGPQPYIEIQPVAVVDDIHEEPTDRFEVTVQATRNASLNVVEESE